MPRERWLPCEVVGLSRRRFQAGWTELGWGREPDPEVETESGRETETEIEWAQL